VFSTKFADVLLRKQWLVRELNFRVDASAARAGMYHRDDAGVG